MKPYFRRLAPAGLIVGLTAAIVALCAAEARAGGLTVSAYTDGQGGTIPVSASSPLPTTASLTFGVGSVPSGAYADGAIVTLGAKADAANIGPGSTLMSVMRQIDADIKATGSVILSPTSSSTYGITPVVSTAAEASHVLKASAGNLYSVYATSTVAGYLMVFNATSAPVDGAVTPVECLPMPTSGQAYGLAFAGQPPEVFSTGITAVFSTTGCFTKTASATAFIHGAVQ